ncbi:MAG: class I SAM-dependent methyltransferase [Planctomycetota bacterium]|nr:class I SAM-dependent methyltransferase [Planctomycetota bacterium]
MSSSPEQRTDSGIPRDWGSFYRAVAGKPARETLLDALARFEAEGRTGLHAVDLGCGSGRDTLELLRRGWTVTALDHDPGSFPAFVPALAPELASRLTTIAASYEDADWPGADLVNASFSIPHCREGSFEPLWEKIARSIRPGGRFAGQFFGVCDGWGGARPDQRPDPVPAPGWRHGREFHDRAGVERLLASAGLRAETLNEVERPGVTAMGEPKYWHVFHVVGVRG